MRYKIGEKVRIKNDLERNKMYYMYGGGEWNTCNNAMMSFRGSIATISGYNSGQYRLHECGYFWTDEMFENLPVNPINIEDLL